MVFGSATAKYMESYIQPTLERAPNNIILHCGTNDLKASTDNVIISEVTPRNEQLNKKAKK